VIEQDKIDEALACADKECADILRESKPRDAIAAGIFTLASYLTVLAKAYRASRKGI